MNSKLKTTTAYAPATVANLNCGFDVLGLALDEPGDVVELTPNGGSELVITQIIGAENLPKAADKNVCTVAIKAMLDHLGKSNLGLDIRLKKGNKVGSGLGSSAASSAAAVMALNALLGEPLTKKELVTYAMEGEKLASGSAHADNVAPSILGGVTLVRGYDPLDVININYPDDLYLVVVHQHIEIKTQEARDLLPKQVSMKQAITQWGNLAGLIAGLEQSDYDLIQRSIKDVIVEPHRATLIPHFYDLHKTAANCRALGFGISGSGPSVFTIGRSEDTASALKEALGQSLSSSGIPFQTYLSKINPTGARVLKEHSF